MTKQLNCGFYIGKIHRLSNRLMNRILLDQEIQDFNGEQGRILHALWQQDRLSQTQLAYKTGLTLNTLTKMLERMMEMNLVERCPHEKDKRKKVICLTDHAKSLKDDYDRISKEMIEIIYQDFSPEEAKDFETCLEKILLNLERVEKEEG